MMKRQSSRIPELDVLRGLCVLGMTAVHLAFDLVYFGGFSFSVPQWFHLMGKHGHILFILLSGICVTLGHHSFQRGLTVLGAGMAVSYVTLFGDLVLHLERLRIWFGILHLLGFSMMIYPLFCHVPGWGLCLLGGTSIILGALFKGITVSVDFLFPLGLCSDIWTGSDFFPIFPGIGWFFLGACLGKNLYGERKSLFPGFPWNRFIFPFLARCGQLALPVYLLHQPVLTALTLTLRLIFR